MRLVIFRCVSIFFLFSLLWNIPSLLDIRWHTENNTAPAIDPSGYANLIQAPAKAEPEKDNSVFMANFFGLPAILLTIGLIWGFRNRHISLSWLKMILYMGLSWFLYEILAYATLVFSAFTMSLAVVLLPIFGAIGMYIFLRMTSYFFDFHWHRGYWLYTLITLMVMILPIIHFFMAFQASVVASLSIIGWQLVFVWAIYESEKQNNPLPVVN